jgi:hypothetical protein
MLVSQYRPVHTHYGPQWIYHRGQAVGYVDLFIPRLRGGIPVAYFPFIMEVTVAGRRQGPAGIYSCH